MADCEQAVLKDPKPLGEVHSNIFLGSYGQVFLDLTYWSYLILNKIFKILIRSESPWEWRFILAGRVLAREVEYLCAMNL